MEPGNTDCAMRSDFDLQALDILGASFQLIQEQPQYQAIPDEQRAAVDSMLSSLQELLATAPAQVGIS